MNTKTEICTVQTSYWDKR